MYENLTSEMKDGFKPVMNMFEIQSRTAGKLLHEQMDFISECLDIGTSQIDRLRDSEDKTQILRVPMDTGREIGERYKTALGKQWNILMEARDALTGEVQTAARTAESTVKQASADAQATVKQASEYVENTAEKAKSKAESSAKNAAEDTDNAGGQQPSKTESASSKSSGSSARKSS